MDITVKLKNGKHELTFKVEGDKYIKFLDSTDEVVAFEGDSTTSAKWLFLDMVDHIDNDWTIESLVIA